VRWAYHKYTTGYSAYGFEYDFFEKDHLGNTRMVLTQQKDTATYLASGEAAYRATESQLFANLTTTTIARTAVPGYPVDLTITNPNDTVFKVNGNVGGHKMGPSLLLNVMSGDKIDIAVQSFYNTGTTSTPNSSITDVLASLATGVVNMTSGGKGSITDLNNMTTSPIYAALNSFLSADDPTPTGKPKAYLNWILLDDQLKYVSSYPQSGAVVVGAAGTLNTIGYTGLPITKNGFLYIWVSNETPNWDAFFDNLVVKQYAGPLLEETHYYPFGLTMSAISSKVLKPYYSENKYRLGDKELQNKEFSDGTGIEEYDFGPRMQDPQLGIWHNIDPLAGQNRKWSPYCNNYDNPIRFIDPDGMDPVEGVSSDDQKFGFSHYTYIAPDDKGKGGLYVGGDLVQAQADVTGLLPTELQNRVSFGGDGLVDFNSSGLTPSQLNDQGVQLLINLTTSGFTYLYTVTDNITVSNVNVAASDGTMQGGHIENVNLLSRDGIVNASNTPGGSEPSNGTAGAEKSNAPYIYKPYYAIPYNKDYDGIVAISGNKIFYERDPNNPNAPPSIKPRESVVFHELRENYYRVEGRGYWAAHNLAIADQMKFLQSDARRSRFPGHIINK
jgi:RHS repeat-associated protein